MRLDPDRRLTRETIDAMEDALRGLRSPPVSPPTDAALRRLSLRLASPDEIGRTATALVAHPEFRRRLIEMYDEAPRYVERQAEEATRIGRLISEGRWVDACAGLGFGLEEFRMAWEGAAALGLDEPVASFVGSLSGPLMETGCEEELASLADAAFVSAERLGRPLLRARMLSMLAVLASRRGDSVEAKRLWTERLEIALDARDLATAADALIDLAGLAYENGENEDCLRRIDAAEELAFQARRQDLVAGAWGYRATVALRRGDVDAACEAARRALGLLTGSEGYDAGLSVRVSAVRTLLDCGMPSAALFEAEATLAMSVEGGKPSGAALALGQVGEALGTLGRTSLGERCLALSLRLHEELGTRFAERAKRRLETLRASSGLEERELGLHSSWEVEAQGILARLREAREIFGAVR